MDTIENLGEFGIIDKINALFAKSSDTIGIGDDCAVIPFGNNNLLVSVDTLIEDVHFFSSHPMYKLGKKAININISDIVACGGKPKWAFLSLSLNPSMKISAIDDFLLGLRKICKQYNIELLGGNTTKDKKFSVNITIIGLSHKPILRSSAKIDQDVYITGKIGCSACGFNAIKNNLPTSQQCLDRFLEATARIDLIDKILPYAQAMIDISDGLLQDADHICKASGIGMDIFLEKIPLCNDTYLSDLNKISFGEDYELLFCAEKQYKNEILKLNDIFLIGETNNTKQLNLYQYSEKLQIQHYGFKHF